MKMQLSHSELGVGRNEAVGKRNAAGCCWCGLWLRGGCSSADCLLNRVLAAPLRKENKGAWKSGGLRPPLVTILSKCLCRYIHLRRNLGDANLFRALRRSSWFLSDSTFKPPNNVVTLGESPCFSGHEDWMLSVFFYPPSFNKPGTLLKIIKISSLYCFLKSQNVHGECNQKSIVLSMFFFEGYLRLISDMPFLSLPKFDVWRFLRSLKPYILRHMS